MANQPLSFGGHVNIVAKRSWTKSCEILLYFRGKRAISPLKNASEKWRKNAQFCVPGPHTPLKGQTPGFSLWICFLGYEGTLCQISSWSDMIQRCCVVVREGNFVSLARARRATCSTKCARDSARTLSQFTSKFRTQTWSRIQSKLRRTKNETGM